MLVTDTATCVIVALLYIRVGACYGKQLYEFFMARSVTEFGTFKHKHLMTELPQGSHMTCLKFPNRYCIYTRPKIESVPFDIYIYIYVNGIRNEILKYQHRISSLC